MLVEVSDLVVPRALKNHMLFIFNAPKRAKSANALKSGNIVISIAFKLPAA